MNSRGLAKNTSVHHKYAHVKYSRSLDSVLPKPRSQCIRKTGVHSLFTLPLFQFALPKFSILYNWLNVMNTPQACYFVTYQPIFTYFVNCASKFKVLIIAHRCQICSYLDIFTLKGVNFHIVSLILSLLSDMPDICC